MCGLELHLNLIVTLGCPASALYMCQYEGVMIVKEVERSVPAYILYMCTISMGCLQRKICHLLRNIIGIPI